MKGVVKSTSTLLLALILLLGIFFLPSDQYMMVKSSLDFLSKSDNAALAFGYYMAQKIANTAVVFGLTILVSVAAKRAYDKRGR